MNADLPKLSEHPGRYRHSAWTCDGDIPGPIVHVKQGDTVEFTLVNHGSIPRSMDCHASQIDPKVAFRSVAPGQPRLES